MTIKSCLIGEFLLPSSSATGQIWRHKFCEGKAVIMHWLSLLLFLGILYTLEICGGPQRELVSVDYVYLCYIRK